MRSRQQRPHAVIPGARRDQAGQVGDQEGQGAQAGQGGGPGGPGGEGRPGRLVAQGLSAPLTTKKRARPISHRNVSAMTVRFFTASTIAVARARDSSATSEATAQVGTRSKTANARARSTNWSRNTPTQIGRASCREGETDCEDMP